MLAVATVVCTTMMAQTPNTITQQLYWLDGDISSAQTVTSTVDISGLLPGLHSCSIRVKDSEGLWSSIVTKYFVIPHYEPTATAITQREYCIDGNVAARTSLGIRFLLVFGVFFIAGYSILLTIKNAVITTIIATTN